MATVLSTQGVQELVADVLRTLSRPFPADLLAAIARAIEQETPWRQRYHALCDELGENIVNQRLGFLVALATERDGTVPPSNGALHALYDEDEVAWLETSARLIAEGRHDALDFEHLGEFLTDMAVSQKHEVLSRLRVLLAHLLKWQYQPDRRTRSWGATIKEQRMQLNDVFESGTLRNYGREVLAKAYQQAVELAATETGLSEKSFPEECPLSWEEILGGDLAGE